jgi:predicted N-acyltransferase
MVLAGQDEQQVRGALAQGLIELCRLREASSVHATFLPEAEWNALADAGFLRRTDQQFHWDNPGYANFDDFLATLAARKRKLIKRERREAQSADITLHWLTGSDLTEAVWDAFFRFYIDTGSRKWGKPYLTRSFFSMVSESMGDQILLVMAKRAGRWIAGALNFIGGGTLYGRHWGAIEHHPFLHFEVCYYQAIEFAITRGLKRVEAGAQGEHKLARGYLPVTTYSAHYIANPALRRAVRDFLAHERVYVAAAGEELARAAPYRRDLVEQD